jgi:hypothetical protein
MLKRKRNAESESDDDERPAAIEVGSDETDEGASAVADAPADVIDVVSDETDAAAASFAEAAGEEEYEVEKIVQRRPFRKGDPAKIDGDDGYLYRVKWQGWPSSDNTWEPASNLLTSEGGKAMYEAFVEAKNDISGGRRRKTPSKTPSASAVMTLPDGSADSEQTMLKKKRLNKFTGIPKKVVSQWITGDAKIFYEVQWQDKGADTSFILAKELISVDENNEKFIQAFHTRVKKLFDEKKED